LGYQLDDLQLGLALSASGDEGDECPPERLQ
jgi:hypothetical protein